MSRTRLELPLLLFLVAVSAVGPLTLNGVLPATSAIMVELNTRYEQAQLVLTIFLAANLLSQLVLGPAADRHGRRPVMLFSLVVFVLGSVLCALANSIEMLLFGRFVQGVGAAVCVFLPRTIVRDVHERGRAASVIGYMTTAMMVAPLFGPAIGGWVTDHTSWRLLYAGLGALGMLLCLLSWFLQPETLPRSEPQRVTTSSATDTEPRRWRSSWFSSSGALLHDRGFLACTALLTGCVGVYYGFLAGAPYVAMESRGLSASSYGTWFMMVASGYLSGNLVAGRFSEQVGVWGMIRLGLFPFLIGITLFWLLSSLSQPFALFLPMMFVAFSNGMALPAMITLAMSFRPSLAASASGLAGSAQTAFGVLMSLGMGWLLPAGDHWMFVLLSLSALVSPAGLWCLRRVGVHQSAV